METLGSSIKKHRQVKKMTLVQLGKAVSLTHGYLSNIENDNKVPTPEVLKKISEALECSYMDLMIKAGYINDEESHLGFIDSDFMVDDEELLKHIEANRNEPGDLEFYLKYKSMIFYKNKQLSPEDKKRTLDMLDVLFPQKDKE